MANWISLGFTLVARICPNVGSGVKDPETAVPALKLFGLANCGVLNALKNSARKSKPKRSVNRVLFIATISKLRWSGPLTDPTPIFPNAVPPSAVITGGLAIQATFKKSLRRLSTDPDVFSCLVEHPGA